MGSSPGLDHRKLPLFDHREGPTKMAAPYGSSADRPLRVAEQTRATTKGGGPRVTRAGLHPFPELRPCRGRRADRFAGLMGRLLMARALHRTAKAVFKVWRIASVR